MSARGRSGAIVALAVMVATGSVIAQTHPPEPARAKESPTHDVGKQVFQKWCEPCHAAGPGNPGTTALAALYKGAKPAALEERTDLTPPVVRQFVRKGVSVMPHFRKTEISDAELDALAAYLSRSNR